MNCALVVSRAIPHGDDIALLDTDTQAAYPIAVRLTVTVRVGAVGTAGTFTHRVVQVPHAVGIVITVGEGGVHLGAGRGACGVDHHTLGARYTLCVGETLTEGCTDGVDLVPHTLGVVLAGLLVVLVLLGTGGGAGTSVGNSTGADVGTLVNRCSLAIVDT